MRAGVLARVSTEEQAADDRHSLTVQLRMMESYAAREGMSIVKVFEIPGESAYTPDFSKRPLFMEAIASGQRGEFDVLLVYDLTRFARDQRVLHECLYRLRTANVRMVGVLNGIDYTSEEGALMAGVEGAFANKSSMEHGRRVRHAIAQRFERGLHVSDVPFGYQRTGLNTPVEIVPDEAEAVRWAYQSYRDGGSYLAIVREFNRRGLRPHSKSRRIAGSIRRAPLVEFTFTSVQRILENPFYIGYVSHKGKRKLGLHQPILDEGLYSAVQSRRRTSVRRAPRMASPLGGLAYCKVCTGGVWREESGSGRRYYRERYSGQTNQCPSRGGWRAEEVEGRLDAVIGALADDGQWLSQVETEQWLAVRHPENGARKSLDEERRRAINAHIKGLITEAEMEVALREIGDAILALGPEIVSGRIERIDPLWLTLWPQATDGEKNELLRTLLSAARLSLRTKEIEFIPTERYRPLFEKRAEFMGVITPGRTGASLVPRVFDLSELVGKAS